MRSRYVQRTVLSAMFSALILVVTGFLPRIAVSAGLGGYIHFGDAVTYIAACLLPFPWGAAAGAVGESLSDLLTGYAVWAPGTFVIKALMVLAFTSRSQKLLCLKNTLAVVLAGIVTVAGYYLYEAAIVGSFAVPLASAPGNIIQAGSSAVIFIAVAFILDRVNIKNKLDRSFDDDKYRQR